MYQKNFSSEKQRAMKKMILNQLQLWLVNENDSAKLFALARLLFSYMEYHSTLSRMFPKKVSGKQRGIKTTFQILQLVKVWDQEIEYEKITSLLLYIFVREMYPTALKG